MTSQLPCCLHIWFDAVKARAADLKQKGHIVMGVMKMGNTVPRAGLEPTSLTFRASVLPLHNVGSLMSLLYPHLPAYATACLRGQCRPLLVLH